MRYPLITLFLSNHKLKTAGINLNDEKFTLLTYRKGII
ncbi:MAG: hypothetical protein ANABAC_2894 [Anaerolineae bacterium]|nr:MAG: hypothetical protein ANABAC_2894 [Anaerolineae bacterium]